jgi:tripartite-type tricarboxylate transporter receptor subunit TctC
MPSHLAKPQIEAQKLIPIAVNIPQRTWMFPDVPTLNESGYVNANVTFKMMMSAPAGTPKPIIDKIATDVRTFMTDPEFHEKSIKPLGQIVIVDTPEQFKQYIQKTKATLEKVVKEAKFNVE